jgi:AAA15 family ATPase/GTPase
MEKGNNVRKYPTNILEVGKQKLLKSAVLFGGNANGKTNLLSALNLMRFLVVQPTQNEQQRLPVDTFGYNLENTSLNIKFIKMGRVFDYRLIYNANEFVFEKLVIDNKLFFERDHRTFVKLPRQLEVVKTNIRKNQNLLFFAQANNVFEATIAFDWFLENLVIVKTDQIPNVLFKALLDDAFKHKFLKFLRAADFNIIDVEVKEKAWSGVKLDFSTTRNTNTDDEFGVVYDVYSTHKAEDSTFEVNFAQESSGTQVFMFLALFILHNENAGKVLLIDEFDRSFHLELAQALLDVFHDARQTNQFILTTHELALMDYKLRQDQIWFAEKNEFGESELYSIYDFDDDALTRSDFGYKRRYIEGKFGASQIINKSVLLEVLGEFDGTETEVQKRKE